MSVYIGTTVWDRHNGALTPPRAGVVKKSKADGSIELRPTAKPLEATGTLVTTSTVQREADAMLLASLAGALLDQRVTVALEGVVFAGVRVASVDVTWKRVSAGANDFLVTGSWSFAPTSHDGDPRKNLIQTKVETCRVWGQWVEQPNLYAASLANVFGPMGAAIGAALIVQTLDFSDQVKALPVDVQGHYVRISVPQGDVEDLVDATVFTVEYHGKITERIIGRDDGRVSVAYGCRDMSSIFETWLLHWYELNDDGSVADGTEIPPFNALPIGERSSGTPGPDDTHVHDRGRDAGLEWRGSDIAALLVAAYNEQFPDGPRVTLAGQTGALDNKVALDLDGSNVQEQLGQLITRGIGCRILIDDSGNANLTLNTGVAADLTAGGYTVPASDRQEAVDLITYFDDLTGWSFDEDTSNVFDVVAYRMGNPWFAISLWIEKEDAGTLKRTWSADDETAWLAAGPEVRSVGQYAHVMRRWKLDQDWVGASYKHHPFTINVGRTKASNATFGAQGENGEFSDVGNNRFPWAALRFTKSLPFTVGADWTQDLSSGGPGVDPKKQLERPLVFAVHYPGTDKEKWERLDIEITPDDNLPAISLGRDEADAINLFFRINNGQHIVVTAGFRLPKPWRVSWRRDPAERLCSQERAIEYKRPDLEYRWMMNETIVGLKDDGTPKLSGEGVIGAKPQTGEQLLAVGRLRHEHPQRGLTWSRTGIHLIHAPGTFVTTGNLPYGYDSNLKDTAPPETLVTVNAPIGQRAINLDRECPGTTWTTTALGVDIPIMPKPDAPPPVIVNAAAMIYKG